MNKDQKALGAKGSSKVTAQGAVELKESDLAIVAGGNTGKPIGKATLYG